jgi:hypothetical protein
MSLLHILGIEFLQAFCLGFMSGLQFLLGLEVGVNEFFFRKFAWFHKWLQLLVGLG